jgi:predicted pyridoxine 5'-phosphate oxidase superfamily flavin-nucleotide-binding protein
MPERVSDVAFTESVKAQQSKRGSRDKLLKSIEKRDWRNSVTEDLAAFIAERDSFYLATASAAGQPYIQHRGGPKGFLHVLDEGTLGFADFAGNRHYISLGNLAENDRAHIFLMDYAGRQRVKLWGTAKVVEDDADLLARLTPDGYRARPERVILFTIAAIDINCPQHIVQRFDEATVRLETEKLAARVAELEAENKALRRELAARA